MSEEHVRAVLKELLDVATSDEWNGAMMYAAIHGYHGSDSGRERSGKAIDAARRLIYPDHPALPENVKEQ